MSDAKAFTSWESAVRWLRDQPDRQELVRAAFYDDPLDRAAERYFLSTEWEAVRDLLPVGRGAALDIGAGRGIASYALAREGFAVTALEPDPSTLVGAGAIRALAQASALPIAVVEDFSERLPFADASFDVVFARAVLHHARNLPAACREVFRVLRPGGRFLAVREHVISRRSDLPAFLDAHPLHHLYGGEHAYLLDEYRAALALAGFDVGATLAPLLSPINYFPLSRDGLRRELCARAGRVPAGAALLGKVLAHERTFDLALKVVARFDHRPGRLYSFVCDKKGAD